MPILGSNGSEGQNGERPIYARYEAAIKPNQAQQDILIQAININDPTVANEPRVYLNERDRQIFLERLYRDFDFKASAWDIIPKLPARHQQTTAEELLHDVEHYPEAKYAQLIINFIALSSSKYPDKRIYDACVLRSTTGIHELALLIQNAPNILTFVALNQRLLEQVKQEQGVNERNAYLHTSMVLGGLLYGKQYELMWQLQHLEDASYLYSDDYTASFLRSRVSTPSRKATTKQEPELPPPVDMGSQAAAGTVTPEREIRKLRVAEDRYEENSAEVSAAVGHIKANHGIPFVLESPTSYHLFQTPDSPQYLAWLKADPWFALSQIKTMAAAVRTEGLRNGNKVDVRTPTELFHRQMQLLLHPDSGNKYGNISGISPIEKGIRSALFQTYQQALAKNKAKEFYGFA